MKSLSEDIFYLVSLMKRHSLQMPRSAVPAVPGSIQAVCLCLQGMGGLAGRPDKGQKWLSNFSFHAARETPG